MQYYSKDWYYEVRKVREYTTTVTTKGQVTIPGALRRELNIKPKDRIAVELRDGEIRMRRVRSPVEASFGAVRPINSPEDFRAIRRQIEEDIAEDAIRGL